MGQHERWANSDVTAALVSLLRVRGQALQRAAALPEGRGAVQHQLRIAGTYGNAVVNRYTKQMMNGTAPPFDLDRNRRGRS